MLTHWKLLKWFDIQVLDVECLVFPLVFSDRDQMKKSVQQCMVLPPAQPLVEMWKYKEFSAWGSNDVDENDPNHPSMSEGQFFNFPKPQMKFYQVSPWSFSLIAPRLQNAFNNIAAPPAPNFCFSTDGALLGLGNSGQRDYPNIKSCCI